MMRHRLLLVFLLLPAVPGSALPGEGRADKPAPEEGAAVTVAMEDCKAARPAKITNVAGALKRLIAGPPEDELVKRGTVQVERRKYTLYLPRARSYSTKNTGPSDCDYDNTSTLIVVDQNGDGRMTENDGWFANRPLRLGDKMFDVAEIAADGSRIVLKPSKSSLRGVIVGRVCPPFSFKTADGKEITRESLASKPFLLDVWSVT
jgi:hypothetical protein